MIAKAKVEVDMKTCMMTFIYALSALSFLCFSPRALAQQTGDEVKASDQSKSPPGDSKGTKAKKDDDKAFETWGSDSKKSSPAEDPSKTGDTKAVKKEEKDVKKVDSQSNDSSDKIRKGPQVPKGVAPHPMDAHEGEMNRSMPKPPPPVRHAPDEAAKNEHAVVPPAGGEEKNLNLREHQMNNAPKRRFKRYDIGVSTGFGAGATDSFSRSTSVIWKVSGEFFFDRVGISPFILADKGRSLTDEGLTFFVSFGVQLKYRFFTDKVFQPYVSAGAAVAFNSGKTYGDSTAGPLAGVGALIKLNEIFYLNFDSFFLFPLSGSSQGNSDSNMAYIELGDLLFTANLGAAILF